MVFIVPVRQALGQTLGGGRGGGVDGRLFGEWEDQQLHSSIKLTGKPPGTQPSDLHKSGLKDSRHTHGGSSG